MTLSSSQIAFIKGIIVGHLCTQKAKTWLIFIPSSTVMKIDFSKERFIDNGNTLPRYRVYLLGKDLSAGMALGSLEEVTSHNK